MTQKIETLEPRMLWKYFSQLAQIPHGSENEAAAIEWLLKIAQEHQVEVKKDKTGNVLIRVPASPGKEKSPTVVLQGHIDMVCEKNSDVVFDFEKDPLRLDVKDGWVTAQGTTLGADNGIGVAAALAFLDEKGAVHGPLELLFTVEEETGLTGASSLEPGFVTGKTLLNLDSEEDTTFFIGCAGGSDQHLSLKLTLVPPSTGAKGIRIAVTGLSGGHSGLAIVENRGNAIRLLARILTRAGRTARLGLVTIEGGNKHNAIPREAFAHLAVDEKGEKALKAALAEEIKLFKEEFASSDPDARVELSDAALPDKVMDVGTEDRLMGMLLGLPHGVLSMSRDMPGLVETSTNLAVIRTENNQVKIHMSSRSSVASALSKTNWQIAAVAGLAGAHVEMGNGYPGWKPDVKSPVLMVAKAIYQNLYNKAPIVTAIHAGLECGIIGERFPGMDMISFGPNILNVHSPDEKVEIASVQRFWTLLKDILESLA